MNDRRERWCRALLTGCVCLGLALQQLFVPVHLARDHHVADVQATRAHAHTGHGHGPHGQGHVHASQSGAEPTRDEPSRSEDDEHEPHPAADHLDQLAEPAVRPTPSVRTAVAPVGPVLVFLEAPSLALTEPAHAVPRPPPPRTSAAPRAPPVA